MHYRGATTDTCEKHMTHTQRPETHRLDPTERPVRLETSYKVAVETSLPDLRGSRTGWRRYRIQLGACDRVDGQRGRLPMRSLFHYRARSAVRSNERGRCESASQRYATAIRHDEKI